MTEILSTLTPAAIVLSILAVVFRYLNQDKTVPQPIRIRDEKSQRQNNQR